MKLAVNSLKPKTVFLLRAAALLSMMALTGPAGAIAATDAQGVAQVMRIAKQDRIETRISDLHTKLQITASQEQLWQKVAQVMRENASRMESLRQARENDVKDMTAVRDLQSYGEIADAHADGIRKLTPVFQDLYNSMSDVQKKNADMIFRTRGHHASKVN
ncbi:Spy/CpxP family protein refolding chaperone [Cupriavidus sp. CV2]|uniref:Spy/CpxP family protein refolding chaperone n=1 Tax=Cupriavidus ulmosensis TaxID=3065913 RepID=UPI00296A99BA|nr:Spy/CpxP family protein refolding chaperone [Cupriavidus sp. CV2]MDW3685196.1 Spy/CpxP family protein refolding chaperone [Cupriavidus sp. CV2]